MFWDKQYDDTTPLEDVNELTELWHFLLSLHHCFLASGWDTVLLKTVYKSTTTMHVFAFPQMTHTFSRRFLCLILASFALRLISRAGQSRRLALTRHSLPFLNRAIPKDGPIKQCQFRRKWLPQSQVLVNLSSSAVVCRL